MKNNNIIHESNDTFHQQYIYFLEEKITLTNVQRLMKYTTSLLETWSKPFVIEQNTKKITIPNIDISERKEKYVIWNTRRIKLYALLEEIWKMHANVVMSTIPETLVAIIAYTNAYITQTTKRWSPKLRSINHNNITYSIPVESKNGEIKTIVQNDISHTLTSIEPTNIPIYTIEHLLEALNTSTLPFKIHMHTNEIVVDRLCAAKMSQLKIPKDYVCKIDGQKYTLARIVLRCIEKRWNNIESKEFIKKYVSTNIKNGEKTKLYTEILQNLMKLYYIHTQKHLVIKYNNEKEALNEWKFVKMNIQYAEWSRKKVSTIEHEQIHRRYSTHKIKKKILKSEENDKKTFDKDLIRQLWYSGSYVSQLYNFVIERIVMERIIDNSVMPTITVEKIAYARNQMHASTISDFHIESQTTYFIKSLDHILENYRIDRQTSYNEDRTQIHATNRK
jgi:hypothetical protein